MPFLSVIKDFFVRTAAWLRDWLAAILWWLLMALLAAVPVMLGYSAWWLFLSFPAAIVLVVLIGFLWFCFNKDTWG